MDSIQTVISFIQPLVGFCYDDCELIVRNSVYELLLDLTHYVSMFELMLTGARMALDVATVYGLTEDKMRLYYFAGGDAVYLIWQSIWTSKMSIRHHSLYTVKIAYFILFLTNYIWMSVHFYLFLEHNPYDLQVVCMLVKEIVDEQTGEIKTEGCEQYDIMRIVTAVMLWLMKGSAWIIAEMTPDDFLTNIAR